MNGALRVGYPEVVAGSGGFGGLGGLVGELRHHLAHGRDVPRRSLFDPGLVAVCSLLEVGEEERVRVTAVALLHGRLDALPDEEELAIGFEEEVFMEESMVEVCAGLVPIADPHHVGCAG